MNSRRLFALLAMELLTSVALFGQASFSFRNIDPGRVDAPALDADGVRLDGTNYLAELWGGGTPDQLGPMVDVQNDNKRLVVPFLADGHLGYVLDSFVEVPVVPPYGWAWVQMRAWEARLGTTYEEAAAKAQGGFGESLPFYAHGGDPFGDKPTPPGPLIGLQSFSLRPAAFPGTPAATRLVATTAMQVGFATNGFTTNGFALSLVAATNATYVTEFSTDLRTWAPLSTNHVVDTVVWVRDFGATNSTARFYRARLLPGQ